MGLVEFLRELSALTFKIQRVEIHNENEIVGALADRAAKDGIHRR